MDQRILVIDFDSQHRLTESTAQFLLDLFPTFRNQLDGAEVWFEHKGIAESVGIFSWC